MQLLKYKKDLDSIFTNILQANFGYQSVLCSFLQLVFVFVLGKKFCQKELVKCWLKLTTSQKCRYFASFQNPIIP